MSTPEPTSTSGSGSAWLRELPSCERPRTTRQLAEQGITKGTLRGRKWRQVSRGFHVPAAEGCITTAQRIVDAAAHLAPGSAIGGWAAAYVLGVDWMDGIDPHTGRQLAIDLVAPDLHRTSTSRINYRTSRLPAEDVQIEPDIAITTPRRTAFDGARWATDLSEAVAFLDAMLAFPTARSDLLLEPFRHYVASHHRWIGIGQALDAAELARPGVRSTWESRLRVCWQVEAGLPAPLINVPVFGPDEELLGIADLFDPEAAYVAEYDGDHHRDPRQHREDNRREERFESANVTVTRADRVDIRADRRQLVRRLVDGRRRGLQRDRRRDSWTLEQPAWWIARQNADNEGFRSS